MTRRLLVALGATLFLGTSCGSSGGSGAEPGIKVTVANGFYQAPPDMQGATQPVARYFAGSNKVLYVSGFQYSSACIPEGTATQDGGIITLNVASPNGSCTADAGRDTFEIQPVTGHPRRLVVVEAGQPDIRLDLSL